MTGKRRRRRSAPRAADVGLTHRSLEDRQGAAALLRAVAEGLERGALRLADARAELVLEPPPVLDFELTAEPRGTYTSLTIVLGWRPPGEPGEPPAGALVVEPGADG